MDAPAGWARLVGVWLLGVPAVALSAGMVVTAFGWLGPFAGFAVLGWALVAPVLCTRGVRAQAATGRVRFSRPSDLALLWLTAPWAASWQVVRLIAGRVVLGQAALAVGAVALVLGTVGAAQVGAAGPVVLLVLLGYLTMAHPALNRRLAGPSLF